MSTYFFLICGHTSLAKCAQWLQVMDAYSTTVTLASAEPMRDLGEGAGLHELLDRDLARALLLLRQRGDGIEPGAGDERERTEAEK